VLFRSMLCGLSFVFMLVMEVKSVLRLLSGWSLIGIVICLVLCLVSVMVIVCMGCIVWRLESASIR